MTNATLSSHEAVNAAVTCLNARGELARLLKFRLPPALRTRVRSVLNEMHVLTDSLSNVVRENAPVRRSKRKRATSDERPTLIQHIKRRSRLIRTIRNGIKRGRAMSVIVDPPKVKPKFF